MRSSGSTTEAPAGPGRPWRRAAAAIFSLAVIAATAWFFAGRWPEVAGRLRRLPPATLPVVAALSLLNFWIVSRRNRIQFEVSGARLGALEVFGLTVCNSMLNYLPARGGIAFQAVYLKRRHGFPFVRFLLVAAVVGPLFAGTSAVAAGVFLLAHGLASGAWHPRLTGGLFAGALLAPAGLLAAHLVGRVRLPERLSRVQGWIGHVGEGAAAFRGRPGALAALAACYVGTLLVVSLRSWAVFRAMGHPAPFLALCVVLSVVELSSLVALTPGNLGIREALSVFSAGLIGIPPEPMMAAVLVDRAVNMALIFPLGAVFTHRLLRARPDRPGAAPGA